MVSKYRKKISNGFTYDDLKYYGYDNGKEDFVTVSSVTNVLDLIESDVREISDLLNKISGLTEIDEIKCKVKLLEEKLYWKLILRDTV